MDEIFMKRAIDLARKGVGLTSPNPAVGAVVVRGNKVIGFGYHEKAGGDHAEIAAMKDAIAKKNSLSGATLYSTLEPCCHYGKTGPCVYEIVRFGIKKVVFAHKDPSKKVNTKGANYLKKHGVEVSEGVLSSEARQLNQPFLKAVTKRLPYVTLKAGMSLDGKIATKNGESKWITGEFSRKHAKKLRDKYDAVIVGANTIIADNPVLACKKGRLLRVVIDDELKVERNSRVFRDEECVIFTTGKASLKKIEEFSECGIEVVKMGRKKINIKRMLRYLYKNFGIQSVFVEGGGETNGSFVDSGLVDDVYFYVAPKIIGGRNAVGVVGGEGVSKLKNSLGFKNVDVKMLKDDILIHGIVNQY